MMHRITFFLFLLVLALPAFAQTSETRRVILTDGTVIVGTVVDETSDPIVVVNANGVEQRVPRASLAEIAALYDGRFTRVDPNDSRLFIAPTGRTLGRGAGRLSAYYIFPTVAYGVADRIDLSGGAFFAVGVEGGAAVFNANVKGQVVKTDRAAVSVGGNAIIPVSSDGGGDFFGGTLYAIGTFGSRTRAFSLGAVGAYGVDLGAGDAVLGEGVGILAGYEQQVSNSVKLISENYLFVGAGGSPVGVLGVGPRFFGDHFAFDLAGAVFVGDGDFTVAGPLVNLSYNFGR